MVINVPMPVGLLTDGEVALLRAWAEDLTAAAVAEVRDRCAAIVVGERCRRSDSCCIGTCEAILDEIRTSERRR